MTQTTERYPELRGEDGDAAVERVIADLERAYTSTMPVHRRAAIAQTLRAMPDRPQPATVLRSRPRASRRWPTLYARGMRRILALTIALLLALGGLLSYPRAQAPTPVSAQSILQRAAAALVAVSPDQATHEISQIYVGRYNGQNVSADIYIGGPVTFTVDQWTQVDATGVISRQSTTATSTTGRLVFDVVRVGREVRTYGARGPGREWVVDVETRPRTHPLPVPVITPPYLGVDLPQLVRDARTNVAPYIHLRPSQAMGGAQVDVVEIGAKNYHTTLYVDTRTYVIRGVDVVAAQSNQAPQIGLRMRLLQRTLVPVATVPAGTFVFRAPTRAPILRPIPTIQQMGAAEAIGPSPLPVPVLARDVAGLSLQVIDRERAIDHVIVMSYDYRTNPLDLVRLKMLSVDITTGPTAADIAAANGRMTGQPMTVTIMGYTLSARYTAIHGRTGEFKVLSYRQGTAIISISGYRLSKATFLAAVAALVDGKTHPAVVAHLQDELDQSMARW